MPTVDLYKTSSFTNKIILHTHILWVKIIQTKQNVESLYVDNKGLNCSCVFIITYITCSIGALIK